MKINKVLFYVGIATSAIALPYSATAQTAISGVDGDWDDVASWTGGVVPNSADTVALVRGGTSTQILDVDADTGSIVVGRVTHAQSGSTAVLNIESGGSFSVTNSGTENGQFRLGGGGTSTGGTTATLNIESGGSFSTYTLVNGNTAQADDLSTLNLNGGSFSAGSITLTGTGASFFNVNGGGGSLAVSGIANFGDTATLAFALDGTGASSITTLGADTLTIDAATLLSIDLDSYVYSGSGTDTITLASATSAFATGFDVSNISFLNDDGLSASVVQTLGAGGSIVLNVIPEPGTYALLAGLTGLSFVMLRHRRA